MQLQGGQLKSRGRESKLVTGQEMAEVMSRKLSEEHIFLPINDSLWMIFSQPITWN